MLMVPVKAYTSKLKNGGSLCEKVKKRSWDYRYWFVYLLVSQNR